MHHAVTGKLKEGKIWTWNFLYDVGKNQAYTQGCFSWNLM